MKTTAVNYIAPSLHIPQPLPPMMDVLCVCLDACLCVCACLSFGQHVGKSEKQMLEAVKYIGNTNINTFTVMHKAGERASEREREGERDRER